LDPVILVFLLTTTLKRYCVQIFAARYFRELARLAKKTGFTLINNVVYRVICLLNILVVQ